MAVVEYRGASAMNGEEIVTSYKLYVGADVNASNATPFQKVPRPV